MQRRYNPVFPRPLCPSVPEGLASSIETIFFNAQVKGRVVSKTFVFETGPYIFLGLFGVNIFKRKAPMRTGATRQLSKELVG